MNMNEVVDVFFSSTSSSSSSTYDSESENEIIREERQSIYNFVEDIVPNYTADEFIRQFRLNIDLFNHLSEQFATSETYTHLMTHGGGRNCVSAGKHLLVFLYFVGHEASGYRAVNNIFNITLSSLYRIINRVATWICDDLTPQIIKWSSHAEIEDSKAFFNYYKKFPNVVGIIDGTHYLIDKPSIDPDSYINRKGHYSIHMQGIVNEHKKFIDIFIGYPGSVHDARVFKNSTVYENLFEKCEGGYILGDSAYPLSRACLTPYKDNGHLNDVQQNYNSIHASTRIFVEHTFGLLKQRFRYLYHIKLRSIRLTVLIIKACCTLHNLADQYDIQFFTENIPVPQEEYNMANEYDENFEDMPEGIHSRDQVAEVLQHRTV